METKKVKTVTIPFKFDCSVYILYMLLKNNSDKKCKKYTQTHTQAGFCFTLKNGTIKILSNSPHISSSMVVAKSPRKYLRFLGYFSSN